MGWVIFIIAVAAGAFWFVKYGKDKLGLKSNIEVLDEQPEKKKEIKLAPEVKLLVADDRKADADELKNMIIKTGAQCEIAENGPKCIELVKQNKFDMIFIARDMVRMDGVQTMRNIRRSENDNNKDTPVYVIVSRNSDEPDVFFDKEGFVGHLKKPLGSYVLWNTFLDSIDKEKIEADSEFIEEIKFRAKDEFELEKSDILLSEGIKNYEDNINLYRMALDKFSQEYDEVSGLIMDSLYAKNATTYMSQTRDMRDKCRKLGAMYLSEIFDDHVNMAKNDDMEVAEASWRNVELEWELVVSGICKWLGKKYDNSNATVILKK